MEQRGKLAEVVYYYKRKVAAVAMLATALADIGFPPDVSPYVDEESILNMTDESLLTWMKSKAVANTDILTMIGMLEDGRLFKPILILPYRAAVKANRYQSIMTKLRESHDAYDYRRKLETKLSKLTGKEGHRVMIYCPPAKMQAKEIDTPVMLDFGSVIPLKFQIENLSVANEIEHQSKKYVTLWKLYLFLHPNDVEDQFLVSRVVTAFCKEIDLPLTEAKFLVPWRRFRTTEELRSDSIQEWFKQPLIAKLDGKIVREVEKVADSGSRWTEFVLQEPKSGEEYFRAFNAVYLLLSLQVSAEYALQILPKLPSDKGRVKGEEITAFKLDETANIRQNSDLNTYLTEIVRRTDKEGPPLPPHYEHFQAKLHEYLKTKGRAPERRSTLDGSG